MSVDPRHGPLCSLLGFGAIELDEPIDYAKYCVGFHCGWCGETCSSHGCGCEWSERKEERPADDPSAWAA